MMHGQKNIKLYKFYSQWQSLHFIILEQMVSVLCDKNALKKELKKMLKYK